MKKITALLLALIFVLFLAACGQGENTIDSNESTSNIESEENEEASEEPATEEPTTDEPIVEDEIIEEQETTDATEDDVAVEDTPSSPVNLFFADDQVMDIYKVERTIEAADEELFLATFEAWIAGPTAEEGELASLIPSDVTVQSVEEHEGVAHVSFSSELLNAQLGSGSEAMLLQQIALTMKQFGFSSTKVLIDGDEHPEMFGHVDTSAAIEADDIEEIPSAE
ncbi:GerMN domain-containing protein [Bacillus sp. FJAT-45037]|uniref:GerMN domain-containing protein n=1 Tax=Bacillus sp. FJAT-45037 TaxID=2011007 RepID=UPI000C234624|nr:GerMN domain-containing protein [Bacillus sp. FJAT-45037]